MERNEEQLALADRVWQDFAHSAIGILAPARIDHDLLQEFKSGEGL